MKREVGSNGRLAFLGPLPPPTHGFAAMNLQVTRELGKVKVTEILDVAPRNRGRIAVTLLSFAAAAFSRRYSTIYVGLSGGLWQGVDLLFIALARGTGIQTIVHHHSFAYLNKPTWLSRFTLSVCTSALHVVLCECMRERMREVYGIPAERTVVVSNAAFVPLSTGTPARETLRRVDTLTLGYFSAVTPEKGIFEFLQLGRQLADAGRATRLIIAGPVDSRLEPAFRAALVLVPEAEYRGMLSGEEKSAFFDEIDILIFPSTYENEAEPVAILESCASGVPVISTARGCIGDMLAVLGGIVVREGPSFVEDGQRAIEVLLREGRLDVLRKEVRENFSTLSEEARAAFRRVVAFSARPKS